MDEALFVVVVRGGGFIYEQTIIGRPAVNAVVNAIKQQNPYITFDVTIAAYEYVGTESTQI